MRVHSVGVMLLGAVGVCAVPAAARADDASDAGSAKTLFEHGRDLRAKGDCANALPFFQKAYAVYPSGLGSLRNIAVCQEALGHFASSRDAWLELRRAVSGSTDSKYAGWSEDADRAMAKLAPKIARLTTDLDVVTAGGEAMTNDGVEVTVGGQPLAAERVGIAVDHDPGTYVVRAAGPRVATPVQQTVELTAGESKHVALQVTVSPEPEASAAGAPPAATADEGATAPSRGSSAMRTGGWIALGVGAAGLAGAAVSFVIRQSALGSLKDSCPMYEAAPCDPSQRDAVTSDVNRGQTASTMLTVFGAVGVLGAVTGVVLLATTRPHHASTAFVLSPTGVSAVGSF